jgi:hypothetical protein
MTNRLAIVLVLWLGFAGPALSCVCEAPEDLEAHVASLFNESSIVGVFAVDSFRSKGGRWAVLSPRHAFKGNASELLVRMPPRIFKTDCDVGLRRGDLLLVYAKNREPMHLSMCSRTGYLMSRFDHIPLLFDLASDAPIPRGDGR